MRHFPRCVRKGGKPLYTGEEERGKPNPKAKGRGKREMPETRPFHALRFSNSVDVSRAVTPPYDVGSDEEWRRLLSERTVTTAKLIVPLGGEGKYEEARRCLEKWLSDGTLVVDPVPSLYLYRQTFEVRGEGRERWGVFCLLRLHSYEEGVVLPHEQTYERPILDRLQLLRTCKAHFGPVFGLYHDPDGSSLPLLRSRGDLVWHFSTADGVEHTLWRVSDFEAVDRFCQTLKGKHILIADGHHRYEAALRFRKEGGPNFVLAYLVRAEDPGLVIFPLHRLLATDALSLDEVRRRLGEVGFKIRPAQFGDVPRGHLGLCCGPHSFLLRLPPLSALERFLVGEPEPLKSLEITILHRVVLEGLLGDPPVEYEWDEAKVREAVREGALAFFLPPPSVKDIERAALAGFRMHPKTTYFYPKPLSGLVMWRAESA